MRKMTRLLPLLAALLIAGGLLSTCPAAGAAPRAITPPGWDLAVTLPDYGELKLVGAKGVQAGDLGDDDFEWFNPFSLKDGRLYAINGLRRSFEISAPTDGDWTNFAAMYRQSLLATPGLKIGAENANAQYGGRRWLRYDITVDKPDGGEPEQYVALATLEPGAALYLDCYYDGPPTDLDAQFAALLGDAAPAAGSPAPAVAIQ
jgi:hypothetical protein